MNTIERHAFSTFPREGARDWMGAREVGDETEPFKAWPGEGRSDTPHGSDHLGTWHPSAQGSRFALLNDQYSFAATRGGAVTDHPFTTAIALVAVVALVTLTACSRNTAPPRTPPNVPQPVVQTTAELPARAAVGDTSVPDAATVFAAQDAAAAEANPDSRPATALTKDQELKSMPMPGQANDHSVPAPAKSAGG